MVQTATGTQVKISDDDSDERRALGKPGRLGSRHEPLAGADAINPGPLAVPLTGTEADDGGRERSGRDGHAGATEEELEQAAASSSAEQSDREDGTGSTDDGGASELKDAAAELKDKAGAAARDAAADLKERMGTAAMRGGKRAKELAASGAREVGAAGKEAAADAGERIADRVRQAPSRLALAAAEFKSGKAPALAGGAALVGVAGALAASRSKTVRRSLAADRGSKGGLIDSARQAGRDLARLDGSTFKWVEEVSKEVGDAGYRVADVSAHVRRAQADRSDD